LEDVWVMKLENIKVMYSTATCMGDLLLHKAESLGCNDHNSSLEHNKCDKDVKDNGLQM